VEPAAPIVGSLELEERDFRRAIVALSWILRARVGVGLLLVVIYGGLVFLGHRSLHQMVEPLVVGGLLVGTLFFSPYVRARQSLAALAGGDTHASYRFDDDSVTIRLAGATSTIAYRSLMSYREGKTELLLVSAPGVAHIVPKRAFAAGDASRVAALIAANVKAGRRPAGP
jgi:hypothetical protein